MIFGIIENAIKAKDTELANKELKTVIADIDKACSKGLVKKNTCARQIHLKFYQKSR